MIGETVLHYQILAKLGEGGMGVVYKAEDAKLKRTVALKFLPPDISEHPEEKARFVHEAQAASSLNHPNVTTIHGIESSPQGDFIVMEYVEGRTLKEVIGKEELKVKEILDIGIQVCEGLTAAHEKGIVHRDIKSSNIMMTPRGRVKIMDFGLAKRKDAEQITQTPSTLGTVAYMSPEQASGEAVDRRSDIFSLGVVLYELLTGRLPFEGDHIAAIIYSILNEEPQPIARYNSRVSGKLEDTVFKALAKDKDERYQHIDDLMADLRHERRLLDTSRVTPGLVRPREKKKRSPFLVPVLTVLILVLAFLVLKMFQVEIGPHRGALADENSLAIMYFENVADPDDKDRIAQMITSLLITDLSESQYMRVVSRQRLYDILKLLGQEDLKVIDKTVATEVARRAGVKWIMTGNILQMEPSLVLTAEISEAASGKIVASERVAGEQGEDLFSVVDRLSAQTKLDLSLPEEALVEMDRSVADVTTHSPEAYRYYLEGLDYQNKVYSAEAEKSFQKALEYDSTFAMAYFRLALLHEGPEQSQFIAKASQYSDKVSQKEKNFIEIWQTIIPGNINKGIAALEKMAERYPEEKELFLWKGIFYRQIPGGHQEAIRSFNRAIEIDPLYKTAYNMLAYTYHDIGDFEKSIWAINTYISIAPDEANPYDSRGDLYAFNGKIDQAIESYHQAWEIKPDFYHSVVKLGDMYLFKREYEQAESWFQMLTSSTEKDWRSAGRISLALIPMFQGQLDEALEVLDHGIAADMMEQVEGARPAYKHLLKGSIYLEKGENELAIQEGTTAVELQEAADPQGLVKSRDYYACILAETGEADRADEILESLKKDIERKSPTYSYVYWAARGCVDLIRGDAQAAASHLQKAIEGSPNPLFIPRIFQARAYLQLGRHGEAVADLEAVLNRYDDSRAVAALWAVKAHYLLGLAYERSGWNHEAIEQYEEFIEFWKEADPVLTELQDARERLKRLRISSS